MATELEELAEVYQAEAPRKPTGRKVETVVVDAKPAPVERRWATLLDQPLDETLVQKRKQNPNDPRSVTLKYLEWHTVVRALNRIFGYGQWSTDIAEVKYLGAHEDKPPQGVQVTMTLHVTLGEGNETRFTNTGYSPVRGGWQGVEMATGGATHTALKRCATALGDQFGLSLYEKDEVDTHPSDEPTPLRPPAPKAPNVGEYFECEDCGKEVRGYVNKTTGKEYTTGDLADMSRKQTGGLYCYTCKPKHSNR